MGIVIDIILLAVLLLSIIMGYKKGLIKVIFNLCAFLVAIIITWILYTPVTNLVLEHTDFDENIREVIVEKGVIKVDEKEEDVKEKNAVSEYIKEYVTVPATEKTNNAIEKAATVIAEKVVAIAVAIALFVVVRLLLILVSFLADALSKLPIIKQCNKAGGIIYGVIRGMFIIYIVLAILFFVMSVNNSGMIADTINSSIISKYLYSHNIILDIIF